jgi:hypothetical protein
MNRVEVLLAALCHCVPLFQNKIKEHNSAQHGEKCSAREQRSEGLCLAENLTSRARPTS